jgi:hypothetical protein
MHANPFMVHVISCRRFLVTICGHENFAKLREILALGSAFPRFRIFSDFKNSS